MLKFGEVIPEKEKALLIPKINSKITEIDSLCARDVVWNERRSVLIKARRCIVNNQTLDELFSFELESANSLLFS